eukprot:GHVN01011201.1.p1 GENE.GHVN01011201.1~~GHVN01011201.1.p1  ORF type:complete len:784 (-),score=84.25 GHVN01011201.1:359-2710(-)
MIWSIITRMRRWRLSLTAPALPVSEVSVKQINQLNRSVCKPPVGWPPSTSPDAFYLTGPTLISLHQIVTSSPLNYPNDKEHTTELRRLLDRIERSAKQLLHQLQCPSGSFPFLYLNEELIAKHSEALVEYQSLADALVRCHTPLHGGTTKAEIQRNMRIIRHSSLIKSISRHNLTEANSPHSLHSCIPFHNSPHERSYNWMIDRWYYDGYPQSFKMTLAEKHGLMVKRTDFSDYFFQTTLGKVPMVRPFERFKYSVSPNDLKDTLHEFKPSVRNKVERDFYSTLPKKIVELKEKMYASFLADLTRKHELITDQGYDSIAEFQFSGIMSSSSLLHPAQKFPQTDLRSTIDVEHCERFLMNLRKSMRNNKKVKDLESKYGDATYYDWEFENREAAMQALTNRKTRVYGARKGRDYDGMKAIDRVLKLIAKLLDLQFEEWPDHLSLMKRGGPFYRIFKVWDANVSLGFIYLKGISTEDGTHQASAEVVSVGHVVLKVPEMVKTCSYDDISSFSHELGHALRFLIGWNSIPFGRAGYFVGWDYEEMPSQFLQLINNSIHTIPLIGSYKKSKKMLTMDEARLIQPTALDMVTLVRHSGVHLDLCGRFDPRGATPADLEEFLRDSIKRNSVFRPTPHSDPLFDLGPSLDKIANPTGPPIIYTVGLLKATAMLDRLNKKQLLFKSDTASTLKEVLRWNVFTDPLPPCFSETRQAPISSSKPKKPKMIGTQENLQHLGTPRMSADAYSLMSPIKTLDALGDVAWLSCDPTHNYLSNLTSQDVYDVMLGTGR